MDAFSIGLSGLNSSRLRQLVSANNLANLNTPGYRAVRAETATGPGERGAQVVATVRDLTEGAIRITDNPLDLTIAGNGFFEVTDGAGNTAYTRNGAFSLDANGNLVDNTGRLVSPGIQIPPEATNVQVGMDGTVTAQVGGATAELGQIEVSLFSNPAGLEAQGNSIFTTTGASGIPQPGIPGEGGRGTIRSGMLEMSNVILSEEIVNQLMEEKMFSANAVVIRTADEMAKESINLIG